VSHIVPGVPSADTPAVAHLRPAAPLAERVLLPGDPHRALHVAQHVLEGPRMFNHHRGLWGYTGEGADGEPLSVQATGMGGPSAAVVTEELVRLGARALVRIGTCGALGDRLGLGDLLVATEVIADDGASAALGAGTRVAPDPGLTAALREAAGGDAAAGLVVSSDLFYDPRQERPARWEAEGALAVEMEAAAILRVAEIHGVAAACLLAVSDVRSGGHHRRLDFDELERVGIRLGEVASAALTGAGERPAGRGSPARPPARGA
jgi:DeoD family purine-nucleoside phosphorylase